jgi:DNA repair exonuclease SbcCD nuclease subunit
MFSFIHAADIHLDSPMLRLSDYEGAPAGQIRLATRRALDNLVQLAISEKVNFVLICGDLYDGDWKNFNTGLFFVSMMAQLAAAGIPAYIIAGNHDAANKMTKSLPLPEGVKLIGSRAPATFMLEDIGVAIHGQSFPTQAVKIDLSEKYPPAVNGFFNIGMLHTCATGSSEHDPYAPCSIDGLKLKGYDYWALGHIHKRQVLCDDPLILFPGNLQGRSIKETGPKGCVLVRVEQNRPTCEFHSLDVIRWALCEVDVTGEETEHGFFEKVMNSLSAVAANTDIPMLVRINVVGTCPIHDRIASDRENLVGEIRAGTISLYPDKVWIERVRLNTAPLPQEAPERSGGPIELLLNLIEEIGTDPNELAGLGSCLNELWEKLPHEIRNSEAAVPPNDTETIGRLLAEVRPMLIQRLGISK